MKKQQWLAWSLVSLGLLLTGCGPNKQILRLQRQVEQLQREKQEEVSRLQKEKLEAMQVRSVALERRQKRCRIEVTHMRKQHHKVSRKIARATRKIQRLLMEIVSDTMLMPLYDAPQDSQQRRVVEARSTPAPETSAKPEKKQQAPTVPASQDDDPSTPPPAKEVNTTKPQNAKK
ncbi:MAG: hypothetical protein EP343_15340 [Deltaproteobacteria bacterium]|nr:MAG: hypothetical protein EP343_15340 [Deltaproteobacteria bacterium]